MYEPIDEFGRKHIYYSKSGQSGKCAADNLKILQDPGRSCKQCAQKQRIPVPIAGRTPPGRRGKPSTPFYTVRPIAQLHLQKALFQKAN